MLFTIGAKLKNNVASKTFSSFPDIDVKTFGLLAEVIQWSCQNCVLLVQLDSLENVCLIKNFRSLFSNHELKYNSQAAGNFFRDRQYSTLRQSPKERIEVKLLFEKPFFLIVFRQYAKNFQRVVGCQKSFPRWISKVPSPSESKKKFWGKVFSVNFCLHCYRRLNKWFLPNCWKISNVEFKFAFYVSNGEVERKKHF